MEELTFLKELQKELNEQEHDFQSEPRFWSIMDYKWERTEEGEHERVTIYDPDEGEAESLDDYVDKVLANEDEEFDEEELDELKFAKEYGLESEIENWIEEYTNKEFNLVFETEVSFIAPNTLFLTKEEAKKHLKLNHYHYSEKAHTYAMTAWRAPKVERLIKILETFDWDSLQQSETGKIPVKG